MTVYKKQIFQQTDVLSKLCELLTYFDLLWVFIFCVEFIEKHDTTN